MMTEREVSERWAEMCRSAEATGHSALRVVEAHLLQTMQDLERARHEARRWIDIVNITQRKVEHLQALVTPPYPVRGLTRAHGLHLLNEAGKLIPVDADFSVDEDEGVQVEYVWIGAHDVAGMFWASHAERLAEQITARIKEDAADIRAEALAELRAAPELLEFAQEWLSRQGTDENYMVARARAAIARATGEAA
jgi:hypothetical protein